MTGPSLLFAYCVLIVAASLAGGLLPMLVRLTHTRMQLAISFVGGALLGVGVLHLLPHAYFEFRAIMPTVQWMLAGFMVMFFIERMFHFHQHEPPPPMNGGAHDNCGHDHEHHAHDCDRHDHGGRNAHWSAALAGLAVHSVLDGVALAASVAAEPPGASVLAGLAVFLGVFLHKPFDSLTLGAMMAVGGSPTRLRHIVNGVYSLCVPIGALAFYFGAIHAAEQFDLVGIALAFSAGNFVCIATSDLLPELHFHSHDRVKLSIALVLGLAVAQAIVFVDAHTHDHGPDETHDAHEHGHAH